MDSGYSLSDIASVARDGDGAFSGNGLWIFALLLLLFGSNGNLFGRNATGELSQYATAASQQEILFGQQFQGLNQAINKVGDGLSSLGYSQLQQMDNNTASINGNVVNEGRAIQTQLANCCCENVRNTDSVRYDMANFAAQINSNIDSKFAAIEKSQLEQKLADQAQQINQLQTASMLCGIPKINTTAWGVYPYANYGCGCNNI